MNTFQYHAGTKYTKYDPHDLTNNFEILITNHPQDIATKVEGPVG